MITRSSVFLNATVLLQGVEGQSGVGREPRYLREIVAGGKPTQCDLFSGDSPVLHEMVIQEK